MKTFDWASVIGMFVCGGFFIVQGLRSAPGQYRRAMMFCGSGATICGFFVLLTMLVGK
ncbi:MAG TPA: hypothetical protein VMP11_05605 [Verrucomicrobiae bacterium]|nr:hypothetical protein [Verrucomicrobiae bacterium]